MHAFRFALPALVVLLAAACSTPSGPTAVRSLSIPTLSASTATTTPSPTRTPTLAPSPSPSPVPVATASPTAAATPVSSAAAGITGNWTGIWQDSKHSTINGSFQVTLTQSGSTLSGTIEITNSCVGNGTVDGSIEPSGAISFGAVKGNATVTFTGQVSGDSMSGDYTAPGEACGNGAGTWTATRD